MEGGDSFRLGRAFVFVTWRHMVPLGDQMHLRGESNVAEFGKIWFAPGLSDFLPYIDCLGVTCQ